MKENQLQQKCSIFSRHFKLYSMDFLSWDHWGTSSCLTFEVLFFALPSESVAKTAISELYSTLARCFNGMTARPVYHLWRIISNVNWDSRSGACSLSSRAASAAAVSIAWVGLFPAAVGGTFWFELISGFSPWAGEQDLGFRLWLQVISGLRKCHLKETK